MSNNQTIAAVPINIEEQQVLKTFVLRLIENLDTVLGYRGDDPYISGTTLASVATQGVSNAELLSRLEEASAEVTELVTELQEQVDSGVGYTYRTLASTYYDLDNSVWAAFTGLGQFTAQGSAISNPPVTLASGTTYTLYMESGKTIGGGAVQKLVLETHGNNTRQTFQRSGRTQGELFNSDWEAL